MSYCHLIENFLDCNLIDGKQLTQIRRDRIARVKDEVSAKRLRRCVQAGRGITSSLWCVNSKKESRARYFFANLDTRDSKFSLYFSQVLSHLLPYCPSSSKEY